MGNNEVSKFIRKLIMLLDVVLFIVITPLLIITTIQFSGVTESQAKQMATIGIIAAVNSETIQVKELSEQIQKSTEEHRLSISEIVKSINSMNELTQSNAAGAQQITSISDTVTAITNKLEEETRFFNV